MIGLLILKIICTILCIGYMAWYAFYIGLLLNFTVWHHEGLLVKENVEIFLKLTGIFIISIIMVILIW